MRIKNSLGKNNTLAKKVNKLKIANPKLAGEWHPTKNLPLTPNDVTPGSAKKIWWVCSKGHEWNAPISRRSLMRTGCPYCSGRKVHGDNCLQTTNPKLAKEWHPTRNVPLTPNDVTFGMGKKVWWLCSKDHEWNATIASRSKGSGCPYCAGRKAYGGNSFQAINPELAKEWHPTKNVPLTPNDVTPGSTKKVWWICHRGHEWVAAICSRPKDRGCPYCSGQKTAKEDCLETISPMTAQ